MRLTPEQIERCKEEFSESGWTVNDLIDTIDALTAERDKARGIQAEKGPNADIARGRSAYRDILDYLQDFRKMSKREFCETHGEDVWIAFADFGDVARGQALQIAGEIVRNELKLWPPLAESVRAIQRAEEHDKQVAAATFDQFADIALSVYGIPAGKHTPESLLAAVAAEARRDERNEIKSFCDIPNPHFYSDYMSGAQWVRDKIIERANRLAALPASGQAQQQASVSSICQIHNQPMVLTFYDRPGSPPGNTWVCQTCVAIRRAGHRIDALEAVMNSQDVADVDANIRKTDNLGGYPDRCVHSRSLDVSCASCERYGKLRYIISKNSA